MSRLHTLAASGAYVDVMLAGYRRDPASVPADWRGAFDLLTAYFPHLEDGAGAPALAELIRRRGHLAARLDPLGRPPPPEWSGATAAVLDELGAGLDAEFAELARAWCGSLAAETGHLDDPAMEAWIRLRRESPRPLDPAARLRALSAVVRGEAFERFMGLRFPGKKRFGAEGAESIHAVVQRLLDRAAGAGFAEVVVGAMHRGRLALTGTVLGQSLEELIARMRGAYPLREPGRAADMPYHAGLDATVETPNGSIQIRLLPNPSHLEAVNPVACGFARGRQEVLGGRDRVLPILLHTDASVAAQGVVAETMQLSGVAGHSIGGVVNVVINNQVGFTTDPEEARTSRYCTALWKAIDSLIVHVNGDDVDAALSAADLAFDYRERFAAESVIDLVSLRANGHNELDEPRFTQPVYYALAEGRPSISSRYEASLLNEGLVAPDTAQQIAASLKAELDAAFNADAPGEVTEPPLLARERGFEPAPLGEIAAIAARIPAAPVNAKAARLVAQRAEEAAGLISWANAETFAIGAVLSTGRDVRLTGQDIQRGSFSQRHLVLIDETGKRFPVFEPPPPGWGRLQVHNTPLCEYAALGFEYGYAVARPDALTIWEAQFGDFANGAQIVLDQFICSSAEKWDQHGPVVVLLPHGLEGQGPEHSSGRIERVLQLAARDNLRIAHPSTPANYHHLLLEQAKCPDRPLIVFTPKRLLRLKAAVSRPEDFARDRRFEPVLFDPPAEPARRIVVCSGKIAYDLAEARASDVAVVRLEQLYPFPSEGVSGAIAACPDAEVVWLQEEPRNYGAWSWVRERLEPLAAEAGRGLVACVARRESPSPAGSFHTDHDREQARLVAEAAGGTEERPAQRKAR